MRRGTTPTYDLYVDDDLTGWTLYLTIKGVGGRIDLGDDRLDREIVVVDGVTMTKLTFTLSQVETLRLKVGRAEVQLRAAQGPDPADATASDCDYIEVEKILRDGVIHA